MAEEQPHTDLRLPLTRSSDDTPRLSAMTPEVIAKVVDDFYAACRRDSQLGPIFERHVHNWDEHLALIRSFWSSVILKSGVYAGRPLEAHLAIPGLSPDHFTIWLRLFSQAVNRNCTPPDAELMMTLAGRMARVIIAQSGLRTARTEGRPAPAGSP